MLIVGGVESIERVKGISGKDVTFHKVDLLDKQDLKEVFKKVCTKIIWFVN